MADDGSGGYYLGGGFSTVDGIPRPYLAHARADGSFDATFAPVLDGVVRALARAGNVLYVAGDFATVNGVSRSRGAAFDVSSGALLAWNPILGGGGAVLALAVSGARVFVGGSFINSLAAVDAISGAPVAFGIATDDTVFRLLVVGTRLYISGSFSACGGALRSNVCAVDLGTDTTTAFEANTNGRVRALAASGGTLYLGGDFTETGGNPRSRLAAVDQVTGAVSEWNPQAGDGAIVTTLAIGGGRLYVGGRFSLIGSAPRLNIAALALTGTTNVVLPWNPSLDSTVGTLLAGADGRVAAAGNFTHQRRSLLQ
jgi:hypothetical protein